MLSLMYITNIPEVAQIAISSGAQRIFIDMETLGKDKRQKGLDTVQCRHTIDDVRNMKNELPNCTVLVRCNPIHDKVEGYESSEEEINEIISAGANIIMLPYFHTADEVKRFIKIVDGRARTMLLFETPSAIANIDEILKVDGIDECFIGLNDLSLGWGKKFMFEILADGTVQKICDVFKKANKPYGFGGIASLGSGDLRSEKIIAEHYRLGSSCVILSRSFCNLNTINEPTKVERIFEQGIRAIRDFERKCINDDIDFEANRKSVVEDVDKIVNKLV